MLDHMLQGLELEVSPFAVCEVRRGWRLEAPALGMLSLHYVLRGCGILRARHHYHLHVSPGHLVICPPGHPLRITVTEGEALGLGECTPLPASLPRLQSGGDSALPGVLIACGQLQAIGGLPASAFDHLPFPIHLAEPGERLANLFDALFDELRSPGLGSRAMLSALMKQCLILMLRTLDRDRPPLPWLEALQDPRLAPALEAMTRDLSRRLSLDDLAELTCLSRSSFIEHFKSRFGLPPQRFMSELRLRHAAHLLAAGHLPIKAVAEKVGYRSRSQFSAAFKALIGCDPEGYRRRHRVEAERLES